MSLLRRRRLPRERTPRLDRHERVVAWAGAEGEDVVVVTNLGLWLPGAKARLGWHEIHKANWSGRELTIIAAREVATGDGYTMMADEPAVGCPLVDPDHVPEQVRTRVTRSVAYSEHHPLPGGGGVRVVGRRVPGVDGVRWVVRYDDGTDPDADRTQALTAELVDLARQRIAGPAT
jgi:hypothetical protein